MKFVVDRIEGDRAVQFLYDDDRVQFAFPVKYLTSGLREGDHLHVTFELDPESREQEKERAERLLRNLTRGSDPSQKQFTL